MVFQLIDRIVDYLEGQLGGPSVDDVIKWDGTRFIVGAQSGGGGGGSTTFFGAKADSQDNPITLPTNGDWTNFGALTLRDGESWVNGAELRLPAGNPGWYLATGRVLCESTGLSGIEVETEFQWAESGVGGQIAAATVLTPNSPTALSFQQILHCDAIANNNLLRFLDGRINMTTPPATVSAWVDHLALYKIGSD